MNAHVFLLLSNYSQRPDWPTIWSHQIKNPSKMNLLSIIVEARTPQQLVVTSVSSGRATILAIKKKPWNNRMRAIDLGSYRDDLFMHQKECEQEEGKR
jgi:hypothetical protein